MRERQRERERESGFPSLQAGSPSFERERGGKRARSERRRREEKKPLSFELQPRSLRSTSFRVANAPLSLSLSRRSLFGPLPPCQGDTRTRASVSRRGCSCAKCQRQHPEEARSSSSRRHMDDSSPGPLTRSARKNAAAGGDPKPSSSSRFGAEAAAASGSSRASKATTAAAAKKDSTTTSMRGATRGAQQKASPSPPPKYSVLLPTYCEAQNIGIIVSMLVKVFEEK